MGMQLEGATELAILIRQGGERAKKGVFEQMKKEAVEIQRLARRMAPLDHGPLEESIKVAGLGGGRDESGRFVRRSLTVYIDGDDVGHKGEPISQYAYIMHEMLVPFGSGGYNLGPKSRAKQRGQSEIVGGRFLERAAAEVSEKLMDRLITVARAYF